MRRTALKRSSTPMKRGKPLARTAFKRKAARPNPAGSDPLHLSILRSLPCCVCGRCANVAHHSTVNKGMSMKTSDRDAMPLCDRDHKDFHAARGWFKNWTKPERKEWQLSMSRRYRQYADFEILLLVRRFGERRWEVAGSYPTELEAEREWASAVVVGAATAWWGPRTEAARLLADPTYQPAPAKEAV